MFLLGVPFRSLTDALATMLASGIGIAAVMLCATGVLGFWTVLLATAAAYLLCYVLSRPFGDITGVGVVSLLGMFAVVAGSVTSFL